MMATGVSPHKRSSACHRLSGQIESFRRGEHDKVKLWIDAAPQQCRSSTPQAEVRSGRKWMPLMLRRPPCVVGIGYRLAETGRFDNLGVIARELAVLGFAGEMRPLAIAVL
jgi:hypothetical protein